MTGRQRQVDREKGGHCDKKRKQTEGQHRHGCMSVQRCKESQLSSRECVQLSVCSYVGSSTSLDIGRPELDASLDVAVVILPVVWVCGRVVNKPTKRHVRVCTTRA